MSGFKVIGLPTWSSKAPSSAWILGLLGSGTSATQTDEELESIKLKLLGLSYTKQNVFIFKNWNFSGFACWTDYAHCSETERIPFFSACQISQRAEILICPTRKVLCPTRKANIFTVSCKADQGKNSQNLPQKLTSRERSGSTTQSI